MQGFRMLCPCTNTTTHQILSTSTLLKRQLRKLPDLSLVALVLAVLTAMLSSIGCSDLGQPAATLLCFVAKVVEWLSNGFPPWAAYRALMARQLCGADKGPGGGVRPLCIGEIWRQLFAKCLLFVPGSEAKEACGIDQLCAGLEADVEGGTHAMHHLWAQHLDDADWGFLLIDVRNAFNELNRTAMLWAVRHEWPSGARFMHNCYRHWSMLVL
jgi:hypothetical protein